MNFFFFIFQVPSASASIDSGMALNHCRWHQSGHSIAAGDDVGRIYIYDVAEVITITFKIFRHSKNFGVITLKFEQGGFTIE